MDYVAFLLYFLHFCIILIGVQVFYFEVLKIGNLYDIINLEKIIKGGFIMGKNFGEFMENFWEKHFPWRRITRQYDFSQCYLYNSEKTISYHSVKDNLDKFENQKSAFEGLVSRFEKYTKELECFAEMKKNSSSVRIEDELNKQKFAVLQEYIVSLCKAEQNLMLLSKRSGITGSEYKGLADYAIDAGAVDVLRHIVVTTFGARHCNRDGENVAMRVLRSDMEGRDGIVIESLNNDFCRGMKNCDGDCLGQIAVEEGNFNIVDKCLEYSELAMNLNNDGDNIGTCLALWLSRKDLTNEQKRDLQACFKKATMHSDAVRQVSELWGKNMLELAECNGYTLDDKMLETKRKIEEERRNNEILTYKNYLNDGM